MRITSARCPYLLKTLNVPVYGTPLTIGLVSGKLKEHNLLGTAKLHTVSPGGSQVKLGCMEVELIHVNHSIPDAVALAIHTPAGTVVHTGDFKIDCTPPRGRDDRSRPVRRAGQGGRAGSAVRIHQRGAPGLHP